MSNISKNLLKKKIVICQFDNPPFHWSKQKVFSEIISYVDLWIAHSKQSLIQAKIKFKCILHSYFLNENTFFPINKNKVNILKEKYNLPKNKYIISNFS